ncbi:hypothetical protein NP493_612g02026 [Ridgeia piscesae]|uniref:EGF-like domain-containing protein n=1 Tax=Ridgeia piscesae TaxID=27915 RepID=A0AAD9NNT9_RIDPI|nr:hypothetical protein NP493_612g02026 [Ridgeia piscesae]
MAGYEGVNCDVDIDECASSPCMANSTTNCTDLVDAFQCHCEPGYNGTVCEIDIDECASSPCMANSTTNCTDLVDAFQCHCEPGYNGTVCEIGETSDCIYCLENYRTMDVTFAST